MTTPIDLSAVPYVDGHMHPPLSRRPATADDYAYLSYEGRREYVALGWELVSNRAALRELAAVLGCAADPAAILSATAALGDEEWLRRCVAEGGVGGIVVDTGYPDPADVLPVETLARHVPTAWLARIERVAEDLVVGAADVDAWLVAVAAALEASLDAGACGLKSIVAYRSGLGVGPVDDDAARIAFRELADGAREGARPRVAAKPLCDRVVQVALDVCRARGAPLQLHAGYGDRDIDLRAGNPLEFRWALESGAAAGVPIVFLHAAYPYVREGALLAAVHEQVYLDIAACVPPIGAAELVDCFRAALAVAPLTRIQASSDAAGVIDHVLVGARRARRALGIALGELVEHGDLELGDAERAGELVLGANARRLYGL